MSTLFTRRRLLQAATLVTGSVLLPGVASATVPAPREGQIGLLLPESAAGDSFLAGLRIALPGQPMALRVPMGRLEVAEGAKRLLAAGKTHLIGLMGPNLANAAAPVLEESGATLLAVDTGANLIRTDEESPQIFTHSLGLWRGAVALGAWSVQQYGPRGLALSGITESGYDMLHCFEIGVTEGGGSALPAIVTHLGPTSVDWAAIFQQVREAKPDFVYALYSGTQAVEFLGAWRASGLRIPLVASPFLVDEATLPHHQGRAEGLPSASTWAPHLEHEVNQRFVAAFGAEPEPFTLLGYEAGLLMAANLQAVEGPRGWIRPGALGATRSPLYLRQVAAGANVIKGALPAPAENDPRVEELRQAVRTGWINPYLA